MGNSLDPPLCHASKEQAEEEDARWLRAGYDLRALLEEDTVG